MDPCDIEARLRDFFAERSDVAAAYLFGSVARGSAGPESDVDVAVLYVEAPPRTLQAVPAALESALSALVARPVQVVVLNRAPVDLVHRVLRDGRLLSNRDASKRIAFEVRARNEYFDLLPFLRRYRRAEPRSA